MALCKNLLPFFFSFLAIICLSSCLGKLETLAGSTKDEVELTRLLSTGGGSLGLLSTDKAPFQIAAASLRIFKDADAVPQEELGLYLGLTKPIDELFIIDAETPNVVYVSSDPNVESDEQKLINPVPKKVYRTWLTASAMALGGLALRSKAIPVASADRIMYIATALMGARVFETHKFYDIQIDKDTHQETSVYRIKWSKVIRGLIAQGVITGPGAAAFEERREKLLNLSQNLEWTK
jgi:hypothetical protein